MFGRRAEYFSMSPLPSTSAWVNVYADPRLPHSFDSLWTNDCRRYLPTPSPEPIEESEPISASPRFQSIATQTDPICDFCPIAAAASTPLPSEDERRRRCARVVLALLHASADMELSLEVVARDRSPQPSLCSSIVFGAIRLLNRFCCPILQR